MKNALIITTILVLSTILIAFLIANHYNNHITITQMPSLSLSTTTDKVKVGDTFGVVVTADSNGQLIDGIDVFIKLSPGLEVVSYTPSSALPIHNFSDSVPRQDLFRFSQITNGGQHIAVNEPVAVLQVKALTEGAHTMQFDFTPGSTVDSNMAVGGSDILDHVNNVIIQVEPINPVIIPTPMTPELLAALQAIATEFKVEIAGSVTPAPVAPAPVPFDVKPA